MTAYIDTSALAKCYVREPWSLQVLDWTDRQGAPATAALTLVEFRCLLARRKRAGQIDAALEQRALAEFDGHVRCGAWQIQSVALNDYAAARDLIDILPAISLRAPDALHLAAARACGASAFATADKVRAVAAEALGFTVHRFY
ncbi:MAG: type II toxin-antitoxin system VapC family toxin [Accumulibacter sp.]|uniref:type II toxin-antitoxin system VapC family toxin n=1 Tax=Accumulibacter sp. TaxID=2053492 RepID=UPI002FC3D8EB